MSLVSTLRAGLLADAVKVGQAGKVRLVETPAVPAPVAFGVIDKVVAIVNGHEIRVSEVQMATDDIIGQLIHRIAAGGRLARAVPARQRGQEPM